jgi:nucleoside-diphosphate-sugar epimerase
VKLLVTGASGFVGGSFLRRFRDRPGLVLRGVGRRPSRDPGYTERDLSQPFDLDFDPDVVVHAAARASPWGTAADYRRANVDATRHVIDYCERHGRPRLVYVSTSAVFYRPGHQLGLTEDSPIGPRFVNRYAATKRAGEQLVERYAGSWVVVRPRAVFGPHDTVLFPRILAAARRGRLPLLVPEGGPTVGDLIAIDSLVDYLMAVIERPGLRGAYNLTNAEPVEIQRLLLEVLDALGLPRPTRRVKVGTAMASAGVLELAWRLFRLPGEPPITRFGVGVLAWSKTFDVGRALADLGPPSVSMREGVEAFVRWQKEQPG